MKSVRLAIALCALALMAGGYLVSQWQYFLGDAAAYAKAVDALPVQRVALVLLVALVALAFVPERDGYEVKP